MNRMGDSTEKFIGEDLLQYCKIVDMDGNGVTSVKQENLKKIVDSIDSIKFQENTASAVIALTGPNEKAKFILMNFLLDTLEGMGEKRQQQQATREGFDWSHRTGNSASIQRFLNIMETGSDQGKAYSEGIFFWPEPFLVKNHDEKQVAIWIMNVCRKEGTNSEELEEIIAVLSSRVMTLECCPDNIRFRVLDLYRPIPVSSDASYPEPIYLEKICDSSTNEFRCNPLSDNTHHFTEYNVIKNLNVTRGMNKLLKFVVNAVMDETVVATSSETYIDGLHPLLKIGNMKEVITSVVKHSNEHRQQREKCRLTMKQCVENASKQIEEGFPRFLETWMETQFSTSTRLEMLEVYICLKREVFEEFKSTVNTSLWKKFNELVDSRCKIELEEILKDGFKYVDMLTRLAEQQQQLLGYLPPQKLDEITKQVLMQVENFAGEEESLILDVCKLAHERIADFYKEENEKILDNETELFLQDATQLGKVYYDEVEKYLGCASYSTQRLETLRQKLLARFCGEIKMEVEELRREDEKARSDMEEYLPDAASKVKFILSHSIKYWILNHLHISSVDQMESIYAQVLEGFIASEKQVKGINNNLHAEFKSRLDALCRGECMSILKSIAQPVMKFDQAMKRQFNLHGYLSEAKIAQIADEEFRKETGTIGEDLVLDMIKLAMERLVEIYKKQNQIIVDEEKKVVGMATNKVITAYHCQMKRYMADAPYSPPQLHNVHSKLAEKLVDAFKRACHLKKGVNETVSSEAVILGNRINRKFEVYRIGNERKLAKLQEKTEMVIQKMKTQYNEKMGWILNKYSDGLDTRTLGKCHTTIVTEVKKLLQMEMRSKFGKEEPVEHHLKVLQDYIDEYWLTVVEVNSKNIRQKMEKDEKERREKKRLEAQSELERLQQQQ